MASTIKLKTGTGSAVPSALAQGEVGINIDNGLIYYGSGSGNSVKQLESFTNITSSGNISSSGTITANEYVGLPSGLLSSSADFATAAQGTKADTAVQPADTSSLLLNTTDTFTGDLTVIGDIIAERYIVSSSVTHLTQSFSSGSTIFGDTQDDTHQFTGSISVTGSVIVDQLDLNSNAISSTLDTDVFMNLGTTGFSFEANTGDKFIFNANQNNVDLQYASENNQNIFYIDASEDRIGIGTNSPGEKLTVHGNISASGDVTASAFKGDGSNLTNLPSQTDENFTTADHTKLDGIEASADVTDATNVQAAGALMDSELTEITTVKALTKAGISGSFNAASASFSTRVIANDAKLTANTSNVQSAGALMDSELAEIATVKALTAAGISGSFTAASSSFSTRVTANETITAKTLVSSSAQIANVTLTTAAQTNITQVGTLDALTVDGDVNTSGNNISLGTGEIEGAGGVASLVFKGLADQDLDIKSDGNITFILDDDNDETGQSFSFKNDNTEIANLDESGNLQLDGNITASGNISASGVITTSGVVSSGDIKLTTNNTQITQVLSGGATRDLIGFDADDNAVVGNPTANKVKLVGDVTASANISASGDLFVRSRTIAYSTTSNNYSGDVVSFGNGPSGTDGNIVAGELYYLTQSNLDINWEQADADATSTATNMLGIAVADDTPTFLVKGIIQNSAYAGFTTGTPLYVSTTAGDITGTAPSGTGDIVRVVGYSVNGGSRIIYFNPSNDHIVHA